MNLRDCRFNKHQRTTLFIILVFTFLGLNVLRVVDKEESKRSINYISSLSLQHNKRNNLVHIVKDEEIPEILPYACLRAHNPVLEPTKYMICVQDTNKDQISREIVEKGTFEEEIVSIVSDILKVYPKATFIDIGANIGIMSLAALANNNKVIAIDPMMNHISYLSSSAKLNRKSHLIKYINNAVSDKSTRLYGWRPSTGNTGGTVMLTKEQLQEKGNTGMLVGEEMNSIVLSDVLEYVDTKDAIIKIDVEGFECKVLYEYLNSTEKKIFVPYIVMEWMMIFRNDEGNCPNLHQLINAFYKSGYQPYDCFHKGPLNHDRLFKLWNNVLWVHEDSIHIKLSKDPIPPFKIVFADNNTMII